MLPMSPRLGQGSHAPPAQQLLGGKVPPKAPNISNPSRDGSNLQARDHSPSSSETMGVSVMSNRHQPRFQTPNVYAVPKSENPDKKNQRGGSPTRAGCTFPCDECGKGFGSMQHLKRHKKDRHLDTKKLRCQLCGKVFSRNDNLRKHDIRYHGYEAPSEEKKEDSISEKQNTDILTKDGKPRLHVGTDNELAQLNYPEGSPNELSSSLTSRDQVHPPQAKFQSPRTTIKTEQPEDTNDAFTSPSSPGCSQPHALPQGLEHRGSSQTTSSDESSTTTETYMDRRKRQIVDDIVFNVTQWLRSRFDVYRKNAGGDSSDIPETSQELQSSNSGAKSTDAIKPNQGKGKLTKQGADEADEEDKNKENQQSHGKFNQGNEKLKYACPYFKYNPAKYKDWRICPGPGWNDVHRMKEHLYRRHRQPQYRCGRCWQPFTDEQCFLDHQRADEPCPLRDMEPIEGFDGAQERGLRSRKRPNQELSETQKWKRVYKILFPHILDTEIPSPFYEYDHISQKEDTHTQSESDYLAHCEDYMVREVPLRLRQALGRELDRDLTIVEENLRRRAGDWVKALLEQAFRELRQKRRSGGPSQQPGASDDLPEPTGESSFPTVFAPQPHSSEDTNPHLEEESEALSNFLDLDYFDPFAFLGETELSFDNGGLLENLLQPEEDVNIEEKKKSDSGYGSNDPAEFEI